RDPDGFRNIILAHAETGAAELRQDYPVQLSDGFRLQRLGNSLQVTGPSGSHKVVLTNLDGQLFIDTSSGDSTRVTPSQVPPEITDIHIPLGKGDGEVRVYRNIPVNVHVSLGPGHNTVRVYGNASVHLDGFETAKDTLVLNAHDAYGNLEN